MYPNPEELVAVSARVLSGKVEALRPDVIANLRHCAHQGFRCGSVLFESHPMLQAFASELIAAGYSVSWSEGADKTLNVSW